MNADTPSQEEIVDAGNKSYLSRLNRDNVPSKLRKHSLIVGNLKISTIIISVILALALIIWPLTNTGKNNYKIVFENNIEFDEEGDKPRLIKPRFQGIDKKRQPYNITADEAIRVGENIVSLQNINGDIQYAGGSWMSISSETGDYDLDKKQLELSGSVNVFSDNGYEIFTESAHLDLKENIVVGNEDVTMQGPLGTLKSNGFVVRDDGQSIFFHGNVHLVTVPKQ